MPYNFNVFTGNFDYYTLVTNQDGTITVAGTNVSLNRGSSNAWTAQQYYALASLAFSAGAVTSWNWSTQREAKLSTQTAGATVAMPVPSNLQPGNATVVVYQTSTGGEKLTFASSTFKQGASLSFLVGNANGFIVYDFWCDGTNIYVEGKDY